MMPAARKLAVLGSTGSVGRNTLEVAAGAAGCRIHALSAWRDTELLHRQCLRFRPRFAVVADPGRAADMEARLAGGPTEVLAGPEGLVRIAEDPEADTVMAAISGAAGLDSALAAVAAGKRLLLANKEALVMSGELFMDAARRAGASVIPIDSEHSAVFQCLPPAAAADGAPAHVERITLTASGGPFLRTPLERLDAVTPEQACRHPTWSMGRKISVDSATMMNKGLEIIEAVRLFGLPPDRVGVLVHPQSIVHALVHCRDGSVLAQMACPDMRVPIACGLAWPERIDSGAPALDLAAAGPLEFAEPDLRRFPCLRLGREAAERGGGAPAALNAANEEAVAAFLAGRLRFPRIPAVVEEVLARTPCERAASVAMIRGIDAEARAMANELILKEKR